MEENWRDITGHEGAYQVSDLGNVRSLTRMAWNGQRMHVLKGRTLARIPSGYPAVFLCKNGVSKPHYIHRLVLEAFVGPCPVGKQCRHFPNSDHNDARLVNLSWGTQSENEQDKKVHGTFHHKHTGPKGEDHCRARLTNEMVITARKLWKEEQQTISSLARKFEVSWATMEAALKGKSWKHLQEAV